MSESVRIASRSTVLETPFFRLVARSLAGQSGDPYYSIDTSDYVCVVALTQANKLLLVRQFRPAVEDWTLELPAGHVDPPETPADAARRELLEETGYSPGHLHLMGCLWPDTGRLSNRMWCFFASGAERVAAPVEHGVALVEVAREEWSSSLSPPRFSHALHLAALQMALIQGHLPLQDLVCSER